MPSQRPIDVNHVICQHFVERILIDFVHMEEFLFSYEFPNFVVHSYQFEPLRKNENAHSIDLNFLKLELY